MNKYLIIGASLFYLLLLFAIAWWVERQRMKGRSVINSGWIYALSLAVYCTGWTYYGSVGLAAGNGIEFLTIYLGPSVMCALFVPVLQKILRICKLHRINSIADFISTRYGKNFSLGIIVTLCCVVGVIPYIALQLKAISTSFHVVTGTTSVQPRGFMRDDTFYITCLITFFIILFGTRSADASERNEGMVAAVAFESIIKMVAFVVAGIFVAFVLFNGFDALFTTANTKGLNHFFVLQGAHPYSNWFSMILVSMLAMILLPRQFQVAVVENTSEQHIHKAIWLFPLYLFLINIFVVPIAMGGTLLLGDTADADSYVLSLPMHAGNNLISLLVYIGGFSAATSMVIVETIALAIMVSNHLVLPVLFSSKGYAVGKEGSFTRKIIFTRRASIIIILSLAYLYETQVASFFSLVSIGLVSMAAVAQFAPAVIGGLYWKGASRKGAITGICAGFAIWMYTLIVPSFVNAGFIPRVLMTEGPWGIGWLRPQALLGLDEFNLLAHSVFWSLLVNSICYMMTSVYARLSNQEIYQAKLFVDVFKGETASVQRSGWKGTANLGEIRTLIGNFIGEDRAANLLNAYALRHRISLEAEAADPRIVSFSERILSGVIGSASARTMIRNISKEEEISLSEVLSIARESQQTLELNKELRKKSIELTRATEMLQKANEQLKQMDMLKDEFLYTVTHELRTPVTSIRALSEIVYDNPDMEEGQRQYYVDSIVLETERLSHLITQVLNLERYESGRQRLYYAAVNVGELIVEVLHSLKPLVDERSIQAHFLQTDTIFLLQCDRDMIRQVIYNLVANAIKFVPENTGVISLGISAGADELQVWIADNGTGIPDELHQLVFDKFYQVRSQSLQKPAGSGLGLAICRKVIELHQGRIWVENNIPAGTKFIFALPLGIDIIQDV